MNRLILKKMREVLGGLLGLGMFGLLSNCGNATSGYSRAPTFIAPPGVLKSSIDGGLNRNSVSSKKRIVVKTGSMNLKVENVREVGEKIEQIILKQGGYLLSYDERDDRSKNASFSVRVPAENLVGMMDYIGKLGNVTYRKISVSDQTREGIAQRAKFVKLKQRKVRIAAMYRKAKELKDKLELEKILAKIEEEIFSMKEAMSQFQKFSRFSKLDISFSQSKIRGPLGAAFYGLKWTMGKLFTIRE